MNNEEKNRSCCCSNNNTFSLANNGVNMNSNNCDCNCECNCDCEKNTRKEMLMEIRSLKFAINELALYLDTHPNDEKAICLHKEYCKKYRTLSDKYQKVYGPLTIEFPCNKWRWLEEPWPWERGNF